MLAIKINNLIKMYHVLPNKIKLENGTIINNLRTVNEENLNTLGFKEVIEPVLSHNEKYANVLVDDDFDIIQDAYIRSIIIIPNTKTLSEEKILKIADLKKLAHNLLSVNQWYYDRETKLSKGKKTAKNVPQNIINADMLLYNTVDLKEIEINNLTTITEVINYDINI